MDKKIFLSYCQKNKNEADVIDAAFSRKGIELTRDERDLEYKEEIEKFMQKIREHDFAILLISHEYLLSPNCMYEFLEVLKEKDCKEKMLPIILVHNFYDSNCRVKYSEQWKNKVEKVENEMRQLSAKEMWISLGSKSEELKKYKKIELEIDSIINELQKRKMLNFFDEQKRNFNAIFKKIEMKKHTATEADIDALFPELNNDISLKENRPKTNIGMPKVEISFKSRDAIRKHNGNSINNNFEKEKEKLTKGIVDNGVIQYIQTLLEKEMFCKFIVNRAKNNTIPISNAILKLDNELQKKVMKNISDNYIYDIQSCRSGWETYDFFTNIADYVYHNSSNENIKNLAYEIIESCANNVGRYDAQDKLERINEEKYL
ncbi:toll/interleukin-1 receptor domain-containing protein [Fusobacterium sp.]|uniref:toll/interleukin-1 receptor domain-containing protein n=1 Tax=Fusobacterium sp. TaxID=68766 RepID=UPI00260A61FC|nr:toll/interleukin-1 receptor domain-containing protein [Fusobacterium sp.]